MSIGHGQNRPISPSSRVIHGFVPRPRPTARRGRRDTSEKAKTKHLPQRAQRAPGNKKVFTAEGAEMGEEPQRNDYADSQLLRVSVSNSKMQPEATEHHPRPEPSAGGAA